MAILVEALSYKSRFARDLKGAPPDVQAAAKEALEALLQHPQPARIRIHTLQGYRNPKIHKIDLFTNRSWQLTFEMDGTTAILRRLGRHRDIDDRP